MLGFFCRRIRCKVLYENSSEGKIWIYAEATPLRLIRGWASSVITIRTAIAQMPKRAFFAEDTHKFFERKTTSRTARVLRTVRKSCLALFSLLLIHHPTQSLTTFLTAFSHSSKVLVYILDRGHVSCVYMFHICNPLRLHLSFHPKPS